MYLIVTGAGGVSLKVYAKHVVLQIYCDGIIEIYGAGVYDTRLRFSFLQGFVFVVSNKLRQFSRQIHLWFALAIFIPTVIVIGSGLLLQIKKESDWIQPPTQRGQAVKPTISFEQILAVSQTIPELEVSSWDDVDRLDVRPGKGMLKLLANNKWEAQIDSATGDILQVAYRRSNTIEAIHDGSWFFESAKLWLFLPAGILLFLMWVSGLVLLWSTLKSKYKKRGFQKERG